MLVSGGWGRGWGQQGHAVSVVSVSSVSGGMRAGRGAGSRVSSFSVAPFRPVCVRRSRDGIFVARKVIPPA